jgi:hypothetical protein
MLHQVIPQGPTPAAAAKSAPDRTQILDPKDYWPNVRECPDWPHLGQHQRYNGPCGKAGAEARLEAIGWHLNRAAATLHVPTADERTSDFARIFKRSGSFSNWYALGIIDLSPLGRLAEDEASMMVEACHIRGYLRKLDDAVLRDAEAAEQRKQAEARRTLERYRADTPDRIEEINSLAEAAARHQQRIDDEAAFRRRDMLIQSVGGGHSEAVKAAHSLGLGVPDAPQFL